MRKLGSLSPRALALLAASLTAVVVIAGFVVVLSQSEPRRTGSNGIVVSSHAVVPPGESVCQEERVPAGTASVAPWLGLDLAGGSVAATVESDGRLLARGTVAAGGFPTGITRIDLDRTIPRALEGATICVENRARDTLRVYGDIARFGNPGARAPGFATGEPVLVRLDWYGRGAESGWTLLPRVAERASLVKAAFLGPWSLWVALAVAIALGVAAVVLVLRSARP
jgi:hypothetical protein